MIGFLRDTRTLTIQVTINMNKTSLYEMKTKQIDENFKDPLSRGSLTILIIFREKNKNILKMKHSFFQRKIRSN